jgi:hypothetical protein
MAGCFSRYCQGHFWNFCILPILKSDVEELALELFGLSDKYDIHILKTNCENQLIEAASKHNFHQLLQISHLYQSEQLLTVCKKNIL